MAPCVQISAMYRRAGACVDCGVRGLHFAMQLCRKRLTTRPKLLLYIVLFLSLT